MCVPIRRVRRSGAVWLGAVAVVAATAVLPGTGNATVATFNFATAGIPTPLMVTNNGVTATFSSPADPGGFVTGVPAPFVTLTGNTLFDPGPAGANDIPLDIAFSQPIADISLLFALNTAVASTALDLTTDAGGSTSATGTIHIFFRRACSRSAGRHSTW
jgi:hypothetical protein